MLSNSKNVITYNGEIYNFKELKKLVSQFIQIQIQKLF